jgi:hypothetical protein
LLLISVALLVTLAVNARTLAHVPRAITSVPWWDEWALIQEYADARHGQPLWPILWSPYWGHRIVIGRLLFFADARWRSLSSLTWLLLLIQFAHIAMMLVLAWLLLWRRSRACFIVASTAILNLMLSADQMENFLWRMQTLYVLVFAAATASFLLLAAATRRRLYLLPSILAALLATYSLGNGFLVWPVLVAEAIYLRLGRRIIGGLSTLGAIVIATYLWHYNHPPADGMEVGGMLRHPLDAIRMLGFYLAGPLNYLSMTWGTVVALIAVSASVYLTFGMLRERDAPRPGFASLTAALAACLLFLFLTAWSIVAGRLSPQLLARLHGVFSVPGRYFTPIYAFWTSVGILVLYTCWVTLRRPVFLAFFGIFFATLLFARIEPELVQAEDWADFFRGADALGSAIILDVPDEQLLASLWRVPVERNERIAFLRQEKLSVFAEPHAAWPGQRITELFQIASPNSCQGGVEAVTPIPSQGFRSWRLEGWAWDAQSASVPADILLTSEAGRIVGLGRSGLRHGYHPGLVLNTALAQPSAIHAAHRRSEWIAYARLDDPNASANLRIYGLLPSKREVCVIGVTP